MQKKDAPLTKRDDLSVTALRHGIRRGLWLGAAVLGLLAGGLTYLTAGPGSFAMNFSKALAIGALFGAFGFAAVRLVESTVLPRLAAAEQAVEESRTRLQDFAEATSDWLWEMDADLRFVYASDRFFALSGLTPEAFADSGHDRFAEIHPGNQDLEGFLSDLRNRRPFRDFTYAEPQPDGRPRWFRLSGTPKFDADGCFDGYRGTGTDITAEVRAREEAVESTVRFLDAIENVSDGIAFWDAEDRFVLCTRVFRDQAGNAATLLVRGNGYEDYLRALAKNLDPPLPGGEQDAWVAERLAEHRSPPSTVEVQREDRWLLIRDDESPDGGVVTVATDITAVKQREQELQRVIDTVPMLLGYVDREGRYQLVNGTFEDWFAVTREAIRGLSVDQVHEERLAEILTSYLKKALAGAEARFEASIGFTGPAHVPGYRGNRQIEVIFTPDRRADGRVLGCFMAANDVTERMLATAQLHQSQKMEAVGQLTGGVAHDFNNLLAVIVGSLGMLEERIDGAREQKLVGSALRAARRGGELTQRLLAFGRRQALVTELTDANELVEGVIELLRRTLGVGIEVETRLGDDLWPMDIDRGQLENALLNLAINARDAMPDGGGLRIETANVTMGEAATDHLDGLAAGTYVSVAVIDTGAGMPEEVSERAIEPFFTTKETGQGSGLGLSMVYGFIKQSGGHMEIDSEPGAGTAIRLYLPAETAAEAARERGPATETAKSRGERILVLEDDPEVRQITVAMLAKMGYRTVEAATGRAAVDLAAADEPFDLLFSDVFLKGGMNGPEAAREVKRLRPHVPVLFTSGYSAEEITGDEALEADVQMIAKPYEMDDLARRLRECLDGAAGGPARDG